MKGYLCWANMWCAFVLKHPKRDWKSLNSSLNSFRLICEASQKGLKVKNENGVYRIPGTRSIPKGIERYFSHFSEIAFLLREASQKGLKAWDKGSVYYLPGRGSIPKGIESDEDITLDAEELTYLKHPKRDWKLLTSTLHFRLVSLEASQKGLKAVLITVSIRRFHTEASQKGLKVRNV